MDSYQISDFWKDAGKLSEVRNWLMLGKPVSVQVRRGELTAEFILLPLGCIKGLISGIPQEEKHKYYAVLYEGMYCIVRGEVHWEDILNELNIEENYAKLIAGFANEILRGLKNETAGLR